MISAFFLNASPQTYFENCPQTKFIFIKQHELVNFSLNTDEIQVVSQKLKITFPSIKGNRKQRIAHRICIKLKRGRGIKINKPFVKNVSQHLFRETLENINLLNYKRYVEHKIWIPPEC